MAIDYGDLFGDLGKLIARADSYETLGATTLPADLAALLTQFETRWLPPEGVASAYEGMRSQVAGWRQALAGYADRRLADPDTVLTQLALQPGAGAAAGLWALRRQMIRDGKAVKASRCSLGAPAYASGNAGTGKVFTSLVLDGYNSPAAGVHPDHLYSGQQSQLCVPSETMTLECVADGVLDGLTAGGEYFSWSGATAYAPLDVRGEGSGPGPTVQCAGGQSLLTNGDFESWSGNTPSSWAIAAGTAGTHVLREQAEVFRGSSSLELAGGTPLVRLTQAVSPLLVQGKRRYFVGAALLGTSAPAGATFRAYLSGTGAPATGESLSVPGGSFPTAAWGLHGFFVNFPSPVPSDWALTIEAEGLPSGASLYVDDVTLAPAVYHGGIASAVSAGEVPWQRGDRVTWSVANDRAGKFQDFSRRWWRQQLPSVNTAAQGPLLGLLFTLMTWGVTETVLDSQVA